MKKILALMLTMCMMLAMTPVLAEAAASGTWYLAMAGLTVGTLELNGDGTCTMTADTDGAEQSMAGTWTQEENKVSIEINDQTLLLVLDGESLTFNVEDMAALGLEQSGLLGSGMDLSALSDLIRLSREPGLISQREFSAYQENGTLPEGKTKEDMDAIQLQIMGSLMSLMAGAGSMMGEATAQEQPGPDLTVLDENFYVPDTYEETQEGIYLAKVQNDSDETVTLTSGSLILLDENGNEISQSEFLGTAGSTYLEPGEVTFVSLTAEVPNGAEVKSYTVHLETTINSLFAMKDAILEASASELRAEQEGGFTSYNVAVTFTNTTDKPMTGIGAAVAVRDSEGKLIDIVTPGLYGNELAAGSTIILVDTLNSCAVEYCESNGITLSQTEALISIPVI